MENARDISALFQMELFARPYLPPTANFTFPHVCHLFQWSNPFRTLNYHGRRQPALIIIWTLLFIGYFPSMQSEQVSGQGELWPSERNDPDCASCIRERSLSVLKEDDIKTWRIETTKKQILERLDMEDRPPRVKTKHEYFHGILPSISLPDDQQQIEPTRQIILFPAKIFSRRHQRKHTTDEESLHSFANKTLTLKFHITSEMNESVLHSAVLWTPPDNASTSTVNWRSIDVTTTVDSQIEQRYHSLSLSVNGANVYPGQVNKPRPYLVVQLDPSVKRLSADRTARTARRKRQVTPMCSSTVTQCCREPLYISFKDVGWDDWVIAPDGFQAFYCRGSCRPLPAPSSGATTHASLLQNLLARNRAPAVARQHLAPCCAPTRLSPITIFYSDENNVIKQRILPNMVVESCGCAL